MYARHRNQLDHYPELKPVLEVLGNKIPVRVHLLPIDTRIRNHDRRNTFDDCGVVRRHVNFKQITVVDDCIVLIDAVNRPTITYIVFCSGHNMFTAK